MKDFRNKVAVVTGGASGIGYALAAKCLSEGMHVVLADVERLALERAARELRGGGANNVLAVVTDVAVADEVAALAHTTVSEFGGAHLVFNNAGVGAGAGARETTYDDWTWVLSVNLWGVIHGIKAFLPVLESQTGDCHMVNTASVAGLLYGGAPVPYSVSKHGVVALSESLYFDNLRAGSNVGVSVLCPGFTATSILESERNRPTHLPDQTALELTPERQAFVAQFAELVKRGMTPAALADIVFDGIRAGRLYIVTTDDFDSAIVDRSRRISSGENPPAPQM